MSKSELLTQCKQKPTCVTSSDLVRFNNLIYRKENWTHISNFAYFTLLLPFGKMFSEVFCWQKSTKFYTENF